MTAHESFELDKWPKKMTRKQCRLFKKVVLTDKLENMSSSKHLFSIHLDQMLGLIPLGRKYSANRGVLIRFCLPFLHDRFQ